MRTVDTEPTIEAELLAHARRQTDALESLRQFALVWSSIVVLAALTWIFIAANGG